MSHRIGSGALLLLALALPCQGLGPPPRRLTEAQEDRLVALYKRRVDCAYKGRLGEALRLAQETESLLRAWLGPAHWLSLDARIDVENRLRLARLPEDKHKALGTGELLLDYGHLLQSRGQLAEAEKAFRQALGVYLKAVGNAHLATAQAVNQLALCLQARGQAAQAQPLLEAALAIHRKELGEGHRTTALIASNLALCLKERGKAAEARPLLEKALATCRKELGEIHPDTALCYGNLAGCLAALGRNAQALPLYEKSVAIYQATQGGEHLKTIRMNTNLAICLQQLGHYARARRLLEAILATRLKVQGASHPDLAGAYGNLGAVLLDQAQLGRARELLEKALAISQKSLGENHPDTATALNNLASCLQDQGQTTRPRELFERALAVMRKVAGEDHPLTARAYGNLGQCLQKQGRYADARPLHERAVAIHRALLGDEHPDTGISLAHLADCLDQQGKHAHAEPLHRRSLEVFRKSLGKEHTLTGNSCASLAACLQLQGRAAQALPLFEEALALAKKTRGEDHPLTGVKHAALARCFARLGRNKEARAQYERALALAQKAHGTDHPSTAAAHSNLAFHYYTSRQPAEARPLFEKALAIYGRATGRDHPDAATCAINLAHCLMALGRVEEAIRLYQADLRAFDRERLDAAGAGFDRAQVGAHRMTPHAGLALAHARLGQAERAWRYAESARARNLLDDLAAATPESAAQASRLRGLDERLASLTGLARPTEDQKALRDELARQRRELLVRQREQAAARSAGLVEPLAEVQKHLPADAALVLWVGGRESNWGCVVRSQGPPRWYRLEGTGPKGSWLPQDYAAPSDLHAALANPAATAARRQALTEGVRRRWWAPLERSLQAAGPLPAVKRLYVMPSPFVAALPVEALAPELTVSYTPSATMLVRSRKHHRAVKAVPALALGAPQFVAPPLADPPRYGLFIARAAPGAGADKAGLRPGDVLLRYDGTKLESIQDLIAGLKKSASARATYWREGKEHTVTLTSPTGLSLDRLPAAQAVRAWRARHAPAVRPEVFPPLPGTRAEALALRQLLGKDCTLLLGSDASEQKLDGVPEGLKRFRVLHLATHGTIDPRAPERSALILARDKLPSPSENVARASRGQRPFTGELTVDTILREWKLDADLVVLSACQTGLGRETQSEGLLGFSYALMRAGARSVVLSRWKVDDTATALLMVRFYENLLGKAQGLKKPMGRAEALAEAKQWLRELPKKDAEKLAIALNANKLAGTRGSIVELNVKEKPKLPSGDRPYEHPFFWAAFVLIGDPD